MVFGPLEFSGYKEAYSGPHQTSLARLESRYAAQKLCFPLRISSVNVTKSVGNLHC